MLYVSYSRTPAAIYTNILVTLLTMANKKKKSKSTKQNNNNDNNDNTIITDPSDYKWNRYLHTYVNDKEQFKFNKITQLHLIKHTYNKLLLPKQYFTYFIDYIKNIQGNARTELIKQANAMVDKYENTKFDNEDDEHTARRSYKRAKQIIQVLEQ